MGRRVDQLLAVHRRFRAINGAALSSYVTLSAFLALFPIALLAIAVLGFVSSSSHDLPHRIVSDLGLSGSAARVVTDAIASAQRSRRAATLLGVLGFVSTASVFAGALATAFNAAWQVPNRRLVRARLTRLVWLVGTLVLVLVAVGVTTAIGLLPLYLAPPGVLVGVALNAVLWLWASTSLANRRADIRSLLPTAIVAGVGLEVLKIGGTVVVPHLVASSSRLYGTLGVVFALLAWLLVFGRLVVYVAVLEAMRWESHHPADQTGIAIALLLEETGPTRDWRWLRRPRQRDQ